MAALPPIRLRTVGLAGENRTSPLEGCRQIEAMARADLRRSPYAELWRITCEYHEGILTLRGHVSSFYMKQIAQTIVLRVDGVERVVNRVEVARTPRSR
jgi:osmotically-inducible protein OsmY